MSSKPTNDNIFIGIDAGTSVIKAVAFSPTGDTLGVTSRANTYHTLSNGGVEQNMERTWNDTLAVLQELVAANPEYAKRVVSISVTGQGDGTWLLDKHGVAVQDAWLWLDARSGRQVEEIIQSSQYEDIFRLTGASVNVCQTRSQLRWMLEHTPEVVEKTAVSLHCKDYLYFKLTGELATDPSEGVSTFGSLRTRTYDNSVIAKLGLDSVRHLLPPIVDGMVQAHQLKPDVAKAIGLAQNIPVTLGYMDVVCSALGGGVYSPGKLTAVSIIGSTGMHMKWVATVDDISKNAARTGSSMCFPGGSYVQMQSNMAATLNIDWLLDIARDAIGMVGKRCERHELIPLLDDAVEAAPVAGAMYHPYISSAGERGPFNDPAARASFTGLRQDAGFADLMRAVYEGLAFAARDCYEAMGELPTEVRVSGGGAKSRVLRGILTAVLNRPLRTTTQPEAGAAGACMMAATRLGFYPTIDACVHDWVDTKLGERLYPDAKLAAQYLPAYRHYLRTREQLQPLWRGFSS